LKLKLTFYLGKEKRCNAAGRGGTGKAQKKGVVSTNETRRPWGGSKAYGLV